MTERMIINRLKKLENLKAQREKIDTEIKATECEIQSYMDEIGAEEKEIGEWVVRWRLISKMILQGKALKADHPALYAEYCKESVSTFFKVNKKKGA